MSPASTKPGDIDFVSEIWGSATSKGMALVVSVGHPEARTSTVLVATRKFDSSPTLTFVSFSTKNSRFSSRKSFVSDPSAGFNTLGTKNEMSVPPPAAALVAMISPVATLVAKTGPLEGESNA